MTALHSFVAATAAALALVGATATPAHAADTAPPPAVAASSPRAQDQSWVYRQDDEIAGRPSAPVRVLLVAADSTIWGNLAITRLQPDATDLASVAAPPPAFVGIVDGRGCIVDVTVGRTLQPPPCDIAARAGDTWTTSAGRVANRYKVTGEEDVQVPAGRFHALRLERVDTAVPSGAASSATAPTTTAKIVYWYAQRVGAMVRVDHTVLGPDGQATAHRTQVLESFGQVSEDARRAIRATRMWQELELMKSQHARLVAVSAATPPLKARATLEVTPACRPAYPPAAIRAGATGQTMVAVVITADGVVQDADVVRASGPTREHRILDDAALAAITKCPVTPAVSLQGTPVDSALEVAYKWELN